MRTTVDLPPALHERLLQLAERNGTSLSRVIADMTARGMAQTGAPIQLDIHHSSGMPTISIGRQVTSDEVAAALEDE